MMRTLLIGASIALGIAVTVFNPPVSGILAAGVWIYLVRLVRKQGQTGLDEQMEPRMTERYLKRLKVFLGVAGVSFLVFVVGAIAHNALRGLSEMEQTVSFLVALVALWVFVAATAGGMVMFLQERQSRLTRA
jgi:hypothetical protein